MSTDNRQLMRKQLEQQAKLFTNSQSSTELIVSTLSTCSALLRAIESRLPKRISQSEFDNVFAGYLGIIVRVDGFYKKNSSYFDSDESKTLQTTLISLREAGIKKKEIDEKLANAERENSAINSDIKTAEHLLKVEEEKHNALVEKENVLKKKLDTVKEKIKLLNVDLGKTSKYIENLEPNVERLIQEISTARETYEEMVAYYSEFQRIQDGIKEEGYVDMESFHKKIDSMNRTGENLMLEYDSLLKNLISDIEALQDKIEKRRKPGMVGGGI